MKRFLSILFACLIVSAVILIPVSASGGSYNLDVTGMSSFNNYYNVTGISAKLIYCSVDTDSAFYDNRMFSVISTMPIIYTFRIFNNSDNDYYFHVHGISEYSMYVNVEYFTIPAHSYFDVSGHRDTIDNINSDHGMFIIDSVTSVDYNYSVFDSRAILSNIGNVFSYIYNSPLFGIFLIGITISLGFVAIRFVRKVMWGN